MPKAHETLFAGLNTFDELMDFILRADTLKHPQCSLVGSSVKWSVQGSDGASKRRVGVNIRASDRTHRICTAVLFVIGMQDKQNVQSPFKHRVRFVRGLTHSEQHVQEIAGIRQGVIRIGVVETQTMPISKSCQSRHLANRTIELKFPR